MVVKTVRAAKEQTKKTAITIIVEHLGQMPTQIAQHPATMGRHVPMEHPALPGPQLVP